MPNLTAINALYDILKNSIIIYFLSVSTWLHAEDTLLLKMNVSSSYFTADNLFNIYYINDKHEVIQFNYVDSTQRSYSNKQFGRPVSIDASNAFKILVFYADQNAIVFLDNKLSELSVLNLNNATTGTHYKPITICKEAESDFIWMYDDVSRKLIRLDETGSKNIESEAFDQLFDFSVQDPKLFIVNNKIYLYSFGQGLLIFDNYANYIYSNTNIPVSPDQVNERFYLYTLQDNIHIYNVEASFELIYPSAVEDCLQVMLVGDKFVYRSADAISMYQQINR